MQEIEVVAKTDTVRVRIMALESRELADWHFHTEVTDDIFCLTGSIVVHMKEPDEENKLTPGQRCRIKTGRIHQLENAGQAAATYLLVQGIGKYDFNPVQT